VTLKGKIIVATIQRLATSNVAKGEALAALLAKPLLVPFVLI
jgi:hypothetical protein